MTLRNAFEDLATEATLAALEAKTPALDAGRVPVDIGSATVSIGASVEVSNDAGNPLPISDAGGSITVDAASLPLPTGAATSAKQDTLIAAVDGVEGVLGTIDADTSALAATVAGGAVTVADGGGSLTIDAASLPLPTGAATAANQATIIGHVDGIEGILTTIDADTGNVATGLGAPADAAASSDTGTFSLLALVKRGLQNWTTLLARVPSLTVSSTRLLVDGSGVTQPVSAASLPLPTGAATSSAQSTGNSSLSSIDGKTPALQSGAVPVGDNGGSLTVDGTCYRGAYTITRPAVTAYSAGDVIGDTGGSAIITLSSIGPSGGFIQIQSIRLLIHTGTLPTSMTTLRLHLYSASPTAIADNAAWDLAAGDRSSYLDYIDLPTPTDMGSTLFTKVDYPGSLLKLASASTSLFAVLQTITAATFAENSTVLDLRISAIEMGR